jgi:hypothetical protein
MVSGRGETGMNRYIALSAIIGMLVADSVSAAAAAAGESPFARYRAILDKEQAAIEREADAARKTALDAYGRQLAAELAAAKASGDLEAVLAVQGEKDRFASEAKLPPTPYTGLASGLVRIQSLCREALGRANQSQAEKALRLLDQYSAGLSAQQKQLVKDGRIEDALAVKKELDRIEFLRLDWVARLPKPEAPAATAVPEEPAAQAKGSTLTNSLILHYAFDRNELGRVSDRSGHGNHGNIVGEKRVPAGQDNWAVRLQRGVDRVVPPPALDVLCRAQGDSSFAFWWRAERWETPPDCMSFLCKRDKKNPGLSFSMDLSRRSYYLHLGSGWVKHGVPVGPGVWYHTALVQQGADWTVYHNGEPAAPGMRLNWPPPGVLVMPAPLLIGQDALATDYDMDGLLDEIRVWTRALSAGEIRDLYAAELPSFADSAVPGQAKDRLRPF